MRLVRRYEFRLHDVVTIDMPVGAEVLSIAEVTIHSESRPLCSVLHLWALVDPQLPDTDYDFLVFGTDDPIPDSVALSYVTTVTTLGRRIWHIFQPQSQVQKGR